jgi:hypothetical protein
MAAPLLSGRATAALGIFSVVLGFAAGVTPAPLSWMLAGVAMVAALFGGIAGIQVPRFAVGRPLVKASWIAPLGTTAGLLIDHANTLPDGLVRGVLLTLAVVCVGLAGIPFPSNRGGER